MIAAWVSVRLERRFKVEKRVRRSVLGWVAWTMLKISKCKPAARDGDIVLIDRVRSIDLSC